MKKLALTTAIVMALGLAAVSQPDNNHQGGLFGYGMEPREYAGRGDTYSSPLLLPDHGKTDDQAAPLGTGAALLIGLGAAYLVGKKRKQQ